MKILLGSLVLCHFLTTDPTLTSQEDLGDKDPQVQQVVGTVDRIFTSEKFEEKGNRAYRVEDQILIVNSLKENKIRRLQVDATACRPIEKLSEEEFAKQLLEKKADWMKKHQKKPEIYVEKEVLEEEIQYVPLTAQEIEEIKKTGKIKSGESVEYFQVKYLDEASNPVDPVKVVGPQGNPSTEIEDLKEEDVLKNIDFENLADFSSDEKIPPKEEKVVATKDESKKEEKKNLGISQKELFDLMENKKKEQLAMEAKSSGDLAEKNIQKKEVIKEKVKRAPSLLERAFDHILKGE